MSSIPMSRSALAVLLVGACLAPTACASRRAAAGAAPTPAPGPSGKPVGRDAKDPSSVAIGGGKTRGRLFAGRFPGVTVTETGGGLRIVVRGGAVSFMAGNEPLYVVDGSPLPEGTGGIVYLNPYDVESIEVLKNPSDIGVYGLRGSNGVIRITTIRPPELRAK